MMTDQEIDILQEEDSRRTIERYLDLDPVQAALRIGRHGALLATQIKYLQRARSKLPSFHAARCIIPPLAFEQCSSERTASAKTFAGECCIDLCCGLGVDAAHFARTFRRVVAVERDPALARIARINFGRLGIGNIEVVNDSAENFIAGFRGKADLVYADPARRDASGAKVFRIEECSPDMLALMPRLRTITAHTAVKCSPLFDTEEAFRLFGERSLVEIVSLHGECKEVIVHSGATPDAEGKIRITITDRTSLLFDRKGTPPPAEDFAPPYAFLLVPDVAFYKARLTGRYAAANGLRCFSETGFCFGNEIPDSFPGKAYPIREIRPYQPKKLKPYLREQGISRLNILKKDFPQPTELIARSLGIRQGGTRYAAFTKIADTLYCLLLDHD